MPRLLYYDVLGYLPDNRALLEAAFEVVCLPDPGHDAADLLAPLDACCAPLGFDFDAAKMDQAPRLRAILSNTTGVPHIDMAAAAARDIAVFSLKDEQDFLATITPTAEHAFGLMLALLRGTPWSFAAALEGAWNRFDFGAPAMLSRLSLGLVGMGRLGRLMSRYGSAFGMRVRFYDPYVEAGEEGIGAAEKLENLNQLAAASDVISIHAPANDETRHLIDNEVLAQCRPGAVLINTARGELVDEVALLAALGTGRLAGAALDVLDGEYEPGFKAAEHALVAYARNHRNLLLTPHIGGSTEDAWRETQRHVIERAIAHFAAVG